MPHPARLAPCHFCGQDVDTAAPGTYQLTHGWVMLRSTGGGHAIALPHRQPHWAHGHCVDLEARGHSTQSKLF